MHDKAVRNQSRKLHSEVLFHHGQCHVQPRRHSCRRPDWPIDNVDTVFFYLNLWVLGLQRIGKCPMGGRSAIIEYARRSKDKGSRTDARSAPGTFGDGLHTIQNFF
ncbi:hypothetical protein D3C84_626670 [compost metagenome]